MKKYKQHKLIKQRGSLTPTLFNAFVDDVKDCFNKGHSVLLRFMVFNHGRSLGSNITEAGGLSSQKPPSF